MNKYDFVIRGLHRLETRDYAGAESDLIAAKNAGDDSELSWIGLARLGSGKYNEAVLAFREAFEKAPDVMSAGGLVAALILGNRLDDANRYADKAIGFVQPVAGSWQVGQSPIVAPLPAWPPLALLYRGLKLYAGDADAVDAYDRAAAIAKTRLDPGYPECNRRKDAVACFAEINQAVADALSSNGLFQFATAYARDANRYAAIADQAAQAASHQVTANDGESTASAGVRARPSSRCWHGRGIGTARMGFAPKLDKRPIPILFVTAQEMPPPP
jgi:tetratricopeptide (TPR) repeat protein